MSGYVRATKFEVDFYGEKVTGTLSQLTLADLLRIQNATGTGDDDLARLHSEVLPKYVKDLSGVFDADGEPVPIDEICTTAYFFQLALSIGVKLAEAATPPQKPSETSVS
jgi:hypothetical protein